MPVRIVLALATLMAITVTAAALLWPRAEPASAGGPTLVGDVNCDGNVNSLDALFVLQYNAGLLASLPCPQDADVNGDGSINSLDAALILQYDLSLIEPWFPTPPPPPPPPPGLVGDVNCDGTINPIDAALILQLHARLIASLRCQENADVNGDGTINSVDAVLLIQFGVGPLLPLPPS